MRQRALWQYPHHLGSVSDDGDCAGDGASVPLRAGSGKQCLELVSLLAFASCSQSCLQDWCWHDSKTVHTSYTPTEAASVPSAKPVLAGHADPRPVSCCDRSQNPCLGPKLVDFDQQQRPCQIEGVAVCDPPTLATSAMSSTGPAVAPSADRLREMNGPGARYCYRE